MYLLVEVDEASGGAIACNGPGLKKLWNFWTVCTSTVFLEYSESGQEVEVVTIAMKFVRYLCKKKGPIIIIVTAWPTKQCLLTSRCTLLVITNESCLEPNHFDGGKTIDDIYWTKSNI